MNLSLLQLLDIALKQQELSQSLNISSKMDLDGNKEHRKKFKDKIKTHGDHNYIDENNVELQNYTFDMYKEQQSITECQIDDDRKRRKLLKKHRREAERPYSGQSIVDFINNKVAEFENDALEYKSSKRKKHKTKHKHSDTTLCENEIDVENSSFTEHIKSHKKKKHKQVVEEDLCIKTTYNNEFNAYTDRKKKHKYAQLLQEFEYDCNTKESKTHKKKKKKHSTEFIESSQNEQYIQLASHKKERHKTNKLDKHKETVENNNNVNLELDNDLGYKKSKKTKQTFTQMLNDELKMFGEPIKFKTKRKKHTELLHGLDVNTEELKPIKKRKKHCAETVVDHSGDASSEKEHRKKKLNSKNIDKSDNLDLACKTPKNVTQIHGDTQEEYIIQSSIPEFDYITLRKKRSKNKLTDISKIDTIRSSPKKYEQDNVKSTKNTMDLCESPVIGDNDCRSPPSPSRNIVVGSEQTELFVTAVGVSILNHKNDHGIMESSLSHIFTEQYTDKSSAQLENSKCEKNSLFEFHSDSDESTQLLRAKITDLVNRSAISDSIKDHNRGKGSHRNEIARSENGSHTKTKKPKHRKPKVEGGVATDVSGMENDSFDSRIYKAMHLQPFNTRNISEVKDALDASLIQKDLMLKDQDVSALEHLYITVPWNIPAAHTIETRMTSVPTKTQQQEFKKQNIKLKTGPYLSEEDDTIKANWIEFCELHNIPQNPLPFLNFIIDKQTIISKTERIKFVQYLGRGLADRMLYSIYTRFRKLFLPLNKGKYAREEDEIILTYTKHCATLLPRKFSELATLLNRDRNSVIKRYHTLTFQQDQKWNLSVYKRVIDQLIILTGVENVYGLKHCEVTDEDWQVIVTKLGLTTSGIKLKRKWENDLHSKLFNHQRMTKIQKKLINILYDDDETDQKSVNWNHLAQDFDGLPGEVLHKTFLEMLIEHVPNHLHNDFRASVSYLKNECADNFKENSNLFYHDGILSVC